MHGMTVKVKFRDSIEEVPAHWEVVPAFSPMPGPTEFGGTARKQVVPDPVDGIHFKRVIGAEDYEFEAYRHIPTRTPMLDIRRHRSGLF